MYGVLGSDPIGDMGSFWGALLKNKGFPSVSPLTFFMGGKTLAKHDFNTYFVISGR